MATTTSFCTRWSTRDVATADRVDYWNSKNTALLVGLRSVSFDEDDGLLAEQANYDMGGLRLADIAGNQHVIERHADLIRAHPKPAIFASLVLKGEGFFYQGKTCHKLVAGDLLFYDTQRPYMIGFTSEMRQFIFDCPPAFLALPEQGGLSSSVKVDGRHGAARWLLAALRHEGRGLSSATQDACALAKQRLEIQALLQTVLAGQLSGTLDAGFSAPYLAAAKSYIRQHLTEPALQAEQVAQALGLSGRHLNRLFQAECQTTVTRYIRQQRLLAARHDLSDAGLQGQEVGLIAYKWGFSSQSHFTRLFRQAFGQTPMQCREDVR